MIRKEHRLARLLSGRPGLSRPEKEDILGAVLGAVEVAPEQQEHRHGFFGVLLAVVAAAAGVVLVTSIATPTPVEDDFTARGVAKGPQLTAVCAATSVAGTCAQGGELLFELADASAFTHVALFAFRSDGTAIWYAPDVADGESLALDRNAALALLPRRVKLDAEHPPGRYTVAAVLSTRPLRRPEIREVYEDPRAHADMRVVETEVENPMRHLALALLVGVLVPREATAAERVYGLVVGNNEPPAAPAGDGLATLRYADDDALRYAELLGQFADDVRLHTVLDAQTRKRWGSVRPAGAPTLAAVRKSLKELAAAAEQRRSDGDRVTFYLVFSAHGAIGDDGEAFVSLIDAPLSRAVLFDEILAQIPADRVHLVIDACHAAGVVGMRGKRSFGREVDAEVDDVDDEEADRWVAARTLSRFPHVGVLASTTAGEQAHEWSAIEAGVFSHEVLSALWGAADINGDLRVEYSEVQAFIAAANRRVEDPRAVPKVVARPPPDDPHDPVADLSRFLQSMTIVGDASALGHFHIERGNGQRHLDANLGSSAMTIAVPAGASSFLRTGDDEIELAGKNGETIDLASLPRHASEVEGRGSTATGYRKALFREPYTPDYYRGYVDSIGAATVAFDGPQRRPARPASPPSPKAALVADPAPPGDRPRRRDPARARRGAGITFAVIAGGTGVAAIVTGAMAGALRSDFNAAETEAEAHAIDDRHRPLATAAIVTGAVAAVSIVAAILYIRASKRRTPSTAPTRGHRRSR